MAGQASDLRRAGAEQVLYIPRGTIHHTSTVLRSDEVAGAGKASFHLTVGMEKYFKPVRTPEPNAESRCGSGLLVDCGGRSWLSWLAALSVCGEDMRADRPLLWWLCSGGRAGALDRLA